MDAKEKVIGLQKAYADIILNISKEAAARVMSSERKAVQYQHELKVAKEEALWMLLHLKKMMDDKTSEAEAAALNQQKKIEELEAQLQEAEDIVSDLRKELGEVQAELERLKKSSLQNVNEVPTTINSYESSKYHHLNNGYESAGASEITTPNPRQQKECSECCYSEKDCTCSSHIRDRDLPSIALRDSYKEPGLYRNGCTQRIRACEGNLLDKNSSEEREKVEYKSKDPSFRARTQSELEYKLLADVKLSSFLPFRRKRQRSTKQREPVTCLTKKPSDPPERPDPLPELSSRHNLVSVKDDDYSSKSPSSVAPILRTDEVENKCIDQECEGLKEKMVQLGEETELEESFLPSVSKGDVENGDMPSQPVRERIIKYTFQRKRKRGAMNESEMKVSLSPEVEKRNEVDKSTRKNQQSSKASLLSESSRDSRRLAQVARQFSSLSDDLYPCLRRSGGIDRAFRVIGVFWKRDDDNHL
ncbi:hypothetical protein SASPL_155025 [Salvia splendens]|uniref:Uncharacterized protein n=1 Tax=Salvia splendens TaxID=180675 RepID=A0A8X8W1D6_SALSN|nr:hypothetical protein SASPL_155025 [Salvia splendens]